MITYLVYGGFNVHYYVIFHVDLFDILKIRIQLTFMHDAGIYLSRRSVSGVIIIT